MTALRHLVAWSAVVLSLVPAAGLAQDATAGASISGSGSGRLDIQGEAPSACVLSPPEVTAVINASFQPANGQASILVTQLADPQTAVPLAAITGVWPCFLTACARPSRIVSLSSMIRIVATDPSYHGMVIENVVSPSALATSTWPPWS